MYLTLKWMLIVIVIVILSIPLVFSFINLLKQVQIESTLKKVLTNKIITVGKNVELTKTKINWNISPPEVYLDVTTNAVLTSKQIGLVQDFLQQEMNEEFILIFKITPVTEVRANEN